MHYKEPSQAVPVSVSISYKLILKASPDLPCSGWLTSLMATMFSYKLGQGKEKQRKRGKSMLSKLPGLEKVKDAVCASAYSLSPVLIKQCALKPCFVPLQSLQLFFVLCILQRINQWTFQEMFSHSKTYQNIADTDPWLGMSFLNKHDVILIPFILLLDSCCQPQWRKMPPHGWQLPVEVLCVSATIGKGKKKRQSYTCYLKYVASWWEMQKLIWGRLLCVKSLDNEE